MNTDEEVLAATYGLDAIPKHLRETFDTWMTGKTYTTVKGEDRFWKQDVASFLRAYTEPRKILVVGDVHGYWPTLNDIVKVMMPDLVLQCGDFGYFPRHRDIQGRIANRAPIHWCDGNHEDHTALARFRLDPPGGHELAPNVFYQERGSTLALPDGRVVLFMGGADSVDKMWRKAGDDWFPEELITERDMARLPDCTVDIVISHTCPNTFALPTAIPPEELNRDQSREFLDAVFERYRPGRWYFAHWHHLMEGRHKGCHWTGLNSLNKHGGFAWLGSGRNLSGEFDR